MDLEKFVFQIDAKLIVAILFLLSYDSYTIQ